jgi:hypothetical protein
MLMIALDVEGWGRTLFYAMTANYGTVENWLCGAQSMKP